jgi:hypothetical protein
MMMRMAMSDDDDDEDDDDAEEGEVIGMKTPSVVSFRLSSSANDSPPDRRRPLPDPRRFSSR